MDITLWRFVLPTTFKVPEEKQNISRLECMIVGNFSHLVVTVISLGWFPDGPPACS